MSLKTGSPANEKTAEEIEISQLVFDLSLFSTTVFVFSALLIRFLLNLQTAVLLWAYSLHFQYRLFEIRFFSVDGTKWPVFRILLVFGLGYLLFTVAGVFLINILHKIRAGWKFRLVLTWMAFLLTYSLPAGIIGGVMFFNGFGIAFHWLIADIVIRSMIGVGVLVVMILFRPVWVFLFLKASPRSLFFIDDELQKLYTHIVFFKSWLLGFFILLIFNMPLFDGFWPVFLLSVGLITMPMFNQPVLHDNLFIRKSSKKIFSSRYAILYIIGILVLIRIAGTYSINF